MCLRICGARNAAPSISSRYMSTTQRHPSGALAIWTGRKKLSREARNSRSVSALLGGHEHAARVRDRTMDDVVRNVADEQVAAILRRKRVAAIDGHSGPAGEETRWQPALVGARDDPLAAEPGPKDPPRLDGADAMELGEFALGGNIHGGGRRRR